MIKLKDKTQKEIVRHIIRVKNVYSMDEFKNSEISLNKAVAVTQDLLQILWYSHAIDLETKRRLAHYMSKKFYHNRFMH